MYSDLHVLGLMLCSGVLALCFAVLAVLLSILIDIMLTPRCNEEPKKRGETKKKLEGAKESKEIEECSATNNILVGNYKLRRAKRWKNTLRVSSEVGEI